MAELKNIKGFQQTREMAFVTLSGWDGKSYNGQGRNLRVWTNALYPDKRFVRVDFHKHGCKSAICFHEVTTDRHSESGVFKAEFFVDFDK